MPELAFSEKEVVPPTEQKPPIRSPVTGSHSLRRDQVAPCICLLLLIGCFFAPWMNLGQSESAATLYTNQHLGLWLWFIPVCSVLTFATFQRKKSVQQIFGTVTAILTLLSVAFLINRLGPLAAIGLGWGASLTVLSALVLFAVSGEQRITLPFDLVAAKLGSRKGQVYSHSLTVPAGVHFSAKDFYGQIEAAVQDKQWPGVQVLRIDYTEAGMLSNKREYLRIIRHRHLFDLCASTFGKDYFFSIREAEIPAVVTARAFFVLLLTIFFLVMFAVHTLGILFGGMAVVFLGLFAVWFLFNVLKMGLTKLDSGLIQMPVIGPVYEAWFRSDTYFQQDARMVFLHAVSELTKEAVEDAVSAKGLKFLDFFEKHPILGDLYKRTRTPIEATKQPEK